MKNNESNDDYDPTKAPSKYDGDFWSDLAMALPALGFIVIVVVAMVCIAIKIIQYFF